MTLKFITIFKEDNSFVEKTCAHKMIEEIQGGQIEMCKDCGKTWGREYMKNSTVSKILGWIFIISSFIGKADLFIICSSIFFSANFIIETIEKNETKK